MAKFIKGSVGYWAGKSRKGIEKHPAVEFSCLICGTSFKRTHYAYTKGLSDPKMMPKFCSRACQVKNQGNKMAARKPNKTSFTREMVSGENNTNWKGGVSGLAVKIRKLSKYKEWRLAVYTRDDYICRICGKRGGYLNADHYPVMFYEIMEKYKVDSVDKALECSELWNIDNAQTICVTCHREKTSADLKHMYQTIEPERKTSRMRGLNRKGGTIGRKWKQ